MLSQLNSVTLPRNSIRFYRLKVQSYKTAPNPPSDARCKTQVRPVLLAHQLHIGAPQVGLIFYSSSQNSDKHLMSQFVKGYDEGYKPTPRYERCIGQNMEKGHVVSMPDPGRTSFSLKLHAFTSPEAQIQLFGGFLREASWSNLD